MGCRTATKYFQPCICILYCKYYIFSHCSKCMYDDWFISDHRHSIAFNQLWRFIVAYIYRVDLYSYTTGCRQANGVEIRPSPSNSLKGQNHTTEIYNILSDNFVFCNITNSSPLGVKEGPLS